MLGVARTNAEFVELSYSAASTWNILQRTFKLDTMATAGHFKTVTDDYSACFKCRSVLCREASLYFSVHRTTLTMKACNQWSPIFI